MIVLDLVNVYFLLSTNTKKDMQARWLCKRCRTRCISRNDTLYGKWCATALNPDKTPKKVAYCGESSKEIAQANYNRAQAQQHDEFIKNNTGITDVRLISGSNRSNIECPGGFTKDKDLNEGSGGAYVYMCRKDGLASKGIKSIRIAKG